MILSHHHRQQLGRACKKKRRKEFPRHRSRMPVQVQPPILPTELTARALAFIDVKDVPAVVRSCKEWSRALRLAEPELWLGLVRRHHPTVEEIVRSTTTSSHDASTGDVTLGSFDWRAQFKRRHVSLRKAESSIAGTNTAVATSVDPPRPLSDYIAQVDFVCKNDNGERVGIASAVVKNLSIDDETIEFNVDDLGPQMSALTFTRVDIIVHLIERISGGQTLIYGGAQEDWIDENVYSYDFFDNFECAPALRAASPGLGCYATLHKTGCSCSCDRERERFFSAPAQESQEPECDCGMCGMCTCCECKEKWSCFHRYLLSLHVFRDMEEIDVMTENETLRILQDGLVYS